MASVILRVVVVVKISNSEMHGILVWRKTALIKKLKQQLELIHSLILFYFAIVNTGVHLIHFDRDG